MKPRRTFNADPGQKSIGLAGPDQIEQDLDVLFLMFDPDGESGGVGTDNLQDAAVTEAKIADSSVTTSKMADLSVTTAKLADESVTTEKVGSAAIVASKIMDSAVTETKIADSNVTTAKLANESVTTGKVADKAIVNGKIGDLAVDTSKIVDKAVTTAKLADGSVSSIKIAPDHKRGGDHDSRYYTKEELTPFLRGGDTLCKEEVYIIVTADNGDQTFTYTDGVSDYTGEITPEGYQVFTLREGVYATGLNRVEVFIGDTLRRSVSSGGLLEIDGTSIALTSPEGVGAEVTIKYFERIGLAGEYTVIVGADKPPFNNNKNIWFKII